MKVIKKVLVVYKRSRYKIFQKEIVGSKIEELVACEDPASLSLLKAHKENVKTQKHLKSFLDDRGIENQWIHKPSPEHVAGVDLVIAVGGDGTLLEAARAIVDDTPIFGINSSPSTSVGYLTSAENSRYVESFEAILSEEMEVTCLTRMEILLNGRVLAPYALNDVLFSHCIPAATSNYQIQLGEYQEAQKSSGVWISTAAGSTAAIHSAGGQIMPIDSDLLQYRVRELYLAPGSEPQLITSGFFGKDDQLTITSNLKEAHLYLDGHFFKHDISYGDKISFRVAEHPLHLYGKLR